MNDDLGAGTSNQVAISLATRKVVVVGYICHHVIVRANYLVDLADVAPGEVLTEPGGSGPNVAAWLAKAGISSELLAMTGDDPLGQFQSSQLKGLKLSASIALSGRTPVVVTLVSPDSQRRFIIDKGGPFTDVPVPDIAGFPEWVHVPAFTLYRPDMAPQVVDFVSAVTGHSNFSVDVNSSRRLLDAGIDNFLSTLELMKPSLVMMNEEEAGTLAAECTLARLADTVVIHRGRRSSIYYVDGRQFESTIGIDRTLGVVDTTGAGEAFAAGFLADYGSSGSVASAVAAGHRLAQRAVCQLGAMPPRDSDGR